MTLRLVVEADGGSRGNPGIAAGGAVVIDAQSGAVLSEVGIYVGVASNNVAEYSGMIAGLEAAFERDAEASVLVRLDSKLVVEQMSGRWKIKHPDMQVLARRAQTLIAGRDVAFQWVPRLDNARADAAANEAMDRGESFRRDLDSRDRTESPTWIVLGRTDDGVEAAHARCRRRRAEPTHRRRIRRSRRGWRDRGRRGAHGGCGATRRPGTPALLAAGVQGRALPRPAPLPRHPARIVARHRHRPRCARPSDGMSHLRSRREAAAPALFDWDDDVRRPRRSAGVARGCAGRVRAAARRDRGIRRPRPAAPAHRRRVRGRAHRRGAARRGSPVGCRGPRPHPRRGAGRAPPGGRDAGEARRDRRSRARGPRRSRREPRLAAEAPARPPSRRVCWSNRRAGGSSPSSGIRSSSRCWSTRSCRGCSRRTAGPGSTSGCGTVASGPCTCPAASSPAAGRRLAAGRSSCRASCARRCVRIRAGCSSSRTSRSSSPACSRRWPATGRSPMPRAAATCTRASSTAARSRPARRRRSRSSGRCTARRRGSRGDSCRACAGSIPGRWRLVDDAARIGEDGGLVSTWLGRTSPPPSEGWAEAQSYATEAEASGADQTRARRWARDRGRFTRNFVVQGTAAEWALAWMADLRTRLAAMPPVTAADAAERSGPVFGTRPHLAFFLHDEVIVHTPAAYRRRGRAGGAGCRGIRCPSAVRRLPDRLPPGRAHRPDRAQGLIGARHPGAADRLGAANGSAGRSRRVRFAARAEERPGSTGQGGG